MRSSSSPQATAVSHALASDLCSNFGTIISAMFSNSVRKQTALREKAGTQNEINSKLKFSHFDKELHVFFCLFHSSHCPKASTWQMAGRMNGQTDDV
ncbi:uncharacterized protein LOC116269528 isoform X5 [Papio anubis]|uniref:uncharacterized protein LOC116269528 isoform X5 n=1 Tax=Papio anubis TaxID=9555 RepID=UPI0012ADA330|nr:uncharacterized protein LOC116269528 isoform X5 [Papio anubis]